MNEKLMKVHEIYDKHIYLDVGDKIVLAYLPDSYHRKQVQLQRCDCGRWRYGIMDYSMSYFEFDEHDGDKWLSLAIKEAAKNLAHEAEFHAFIKKACKITKARWAQIIKGAAV